MTDRKSVKTRDDPEQSERFREAARAAGEAAPGEFERAFKNVARRRKAQPKPNDDDVK